MTLLTTVKSPIMAKSAPDISVPRRKARPMPEGFRGELPGVESAPGEDVGVSVGGEVAVEVVRSETTSSVDVGFPTTTAGVRMGVRSVVGVAGVAVGVEVEVPVGVGVGWVLATTIPRTSCSG